MAEWEDDVNQKSP